MKRFITAMCLIFIVSGCTSRHQSVDLTYSTFKSNMSIDSIKTEMLLTDGVEMVIMYPDSNVMTIQYNRFKTHRNIFKNILIRGGYKVQIRETKISNDTETDE